MLKRINEALPGLVVSILLYGVMVELIGVWFVKDRIAIVFLPDIKTKIFFYLHKGQDCIFHRGMVWHSNCRGDGNQSCNCDL